MTTTDKMLTTLADVCDHLGAYHHTNESLSRSVYKGTDCGAWAEVAERPRFETRTEKWTVRYAKLDGRWGALAAYRRKPFRDLEPVNFSDMPPNVREFFLLMPDDAQYREDYLIDKAPPGACEYEESHLLKGNYPAGTDLVFRVGSIVEGVDQEVWPEEVVLPATGKQIDEAIERVEIAAEDIWKQTHGCETCAKRNDFEWQPGQTPVDDECPECKGQGTII